MAEETERPERTLPRAILAALVLTTVIYIIVCWAAVRAVSGAELAGSEQPLALVLQSSGRGAAVLSAIAVFAALNGVLAQIVMASRVLYGLGKRTPALSLFHHAHPRFGTPLLGTALVGAAVVSMALTLPLATLAEVTSVVLLSVFVLVNLALLAVKRRDPQAVFRVPAVVPFFGLILALGALAVTMLEQFS